MSLSGPPTSSCSTRSSRAQPLEEASRQGWTRGLYLRSISRGGQEIPIGAGLAVHRGDLLHIVGPDGVVERAAARIGTVVDPGTQIDFVVLGLAIFFGGLAGVLLAFPVGDMKIVLSTSVGALLLAGLAVGALRTRHPLFGRIPDGAVSLMTSLGLAAFVGLAGINAGPVFIAAVKEAGVGLLLGGMVTTMLRVGLIFGRFVPRCNPILLLGALAGGHTVTAAMAALQERSGSPIPVLGYTPAYPVANIVKTMWGTIMVLVVAG